MASRNIPSLDGLRAVSIALVVACHAGQTPDAAHLPVFILRLLSVSGNLGVRIFFGISGFLITTLLLNEWKRANTINLKRFYYRRTLRIFPPFYVFAGVVALLTAAGALSEPAYLLPAITYTADYFRPGEGALGHAWSLAVEEQFYLLWPFALVALGRRGAMWAAALVVLTSPLIRVGVFALTRSTDAVDFHFEAVADALATGCLLAGLRGGLHAREYYRRALASRWAALVPFAVLLTQYALANQIRWAFIAYQAVGVTLLNVGIAFYIDRAVTAPGRFLNWRPVVYVGALSYSLYLWHRLVLTSLPLWLALPCALAAAALSYRLIELPSLRLRQKLESRIFDPKPELVHLEVAAAGD